MNTPLHPYQQPQNDPIAAQLRSMQDTIERMQRGTQG